MARYGRRNRSFKARVAGFVDYVTEATPKKIDINISQSNFEQLMPLMMRFRYFRVKGLSVNAQPATTLPLNPMQIGDGTGQIRATDILTPCAVRTYYNEYDTVPNDAEGVTQVLSDAKWQKFFPQRGFRKYFRPYMYGVGSTATGPLRVAGWSYQFENQAYYQPRITGSNGNDGQLLTRPLNHPQDETLDNPIDVIDPEDATRKRLGSLMGQATSDIPPWSPSAPNWPEGRAPVDEAWGAWGGIKPIGMQPTRRSVDGQFGFPHIVVGRVFVPGYTSVVYTWRLWWTLYVDLFSPKFHLEPGDMEALMNVKQQRETVFSIDGEDITGTLYDGVRDPTDICPEELD